MHSNNSGRCPHVKVIMVFILRTERMLGSVRREKNQEKLRGVKCESALILHKNLLF